MKTDVVLRGDVVEELEWEPEVNAAQIAATVRDGVVTLTGEVQSFTEKIAAERAALRVAGVKAVADELHVRIPGVGARSDADIAQAVATALEWNSAVPRDRLEVVVRQGWVTLAGEVEWGYQRTAAKDAVRRLTGVLGIIDEITVKPRATSAGIQAKIEQAFKRNAEVDARSVTVGVSGSTVLLRGTVRSWAEKQEAERVAWASPGVSSVSNELRIAA